LDECPEVIDVVASRYQGPIWPSLSFMNLLRKALRKLRRENWLEATKLFDVPVLGEPLPSD
jgi:hypothetical protein